MKLKTEDERKLWRDALLAHLALGWNEPADCAARADEVITEYRSRVDGCVGDVTDDDRRKVIDATIREQEAKARKAEALRDKELAALDASNPVCCRCGLLIEKTYVMTNAGPAHRKCVNP